MAKDSFYIVNTWMIDELGLSGIELQCFAIIWSLSRGQKQMYTAGISHLVEMTKKTKKTIITALKELNKEGLIKKFPVVINGVEHHHYKAIDKGGVKFTPDGCKNYTEVGEKITPVNNESNNIKENKKESNDSKKEELFEIFWSKYRKGSKQKARDKWNGLKDKEKEKAIATVDDYLTYCRRSNRPLKDVSVYLNQKCFNDDWNVIPDYYTVRPTDDDRRKKFKEWICSTYPDLIYHRNPLTFEQACDLFDTYTITSVKKAMKILCSIDIHQYFNIKSGIEKILESDEYDV